MTEKEKWQIAQHEERLYHKFSIGEGIKVYGGAYSTLFSYVNISADQEHKRILEIGTADFPAMYFRDNVDGFIIEPMQSPILETLCKERGFVLINKPAEEADFPVVDEVWMFNLLTHVMNPDVIIEKAKQASKIIRFFEPIDTAISIDHPWTFDLNYYKNKFGGCVQYYPPHPDAVNFHAHECVYGVYHTEPTTA